MKIIQFIAASLLFGLLAKTTAYGQSKDSSSGINKKAYTFKATKFDSIRKINSSIGVLKNESIVKNYSFSVYNKTSKSNDVYLMSNDSSKYSKSKILIENNFRNNKIDSFNPTGAPNVQSGILMGMFNLLVKNK